MANWQSREIALRPKEPVMAKGEFKRQRAGKQNANGGRP
jgi:uncharacterized short protein YbdD (DUF466 family)